MAGTTWVTSGFELFFSANLGVKKRYCVLRRNRELVCNLRACVYMYMLQLDWGKEHSTSVWDTGLPGCWFLACVFKCWLFCFSCLFVLGFFCCWWFFLFVFFLPLFSNFFFFLMNYLFIFLKCFLLISGATFVSKLLVFVCAYFCTGCTAVLYYVWLWADLLRLGCNESFVCGLVSRTLVFLALLLTCSIVRLDSWSHTFCWHSVGILLAFCIRAAGLSLL